VHRSHEEIALLFDDSSGSSAPQTFGAYRVLHQIGSGVLGPVFRSYDSQRDRLIAVKAFKLDIVPEDAKRLSDALRPLCSGPLPDRTLVRLLETGMAGSTAFVAMEFATGESLDVALRHLAPAPLERALPMLDALASAIDTAWAGGLGHGALHPRDVIVAPGTLDVRVTGFGIVPALESIGLTPPPRRPYVAPERAAGDAWDVRADVYSLAVIAHELLTGRRPVGSGEPDEATPLHRVLATALATNPDDRFESGRAFIEALEQVAAQSEREEEVVLEAAEPAVSLAPADTIDLEPELAVEAEPELGVEPEREFALEADPEPALAPERYDEPDPEREDELELEPADEPQPVAAATITRDAAFTPVHAPILEEPPIMPLPVARESRGYPYPWAALTAVGIAGVVLGVVIGLGWARRFAATGPVAPPEQTQARADTEVQLTPPAASEGEKQPAAQPPAQPVAPAPAPVPPPVTRSARADAPVKAKAPIGRVIVRSSPAGALVTIDGRRMGETPVTLRDLPLGSYSVQVARPGYLPETHRVTLSTKTPAQTVSVSLRKGAAGDRAAGTGSIYADTNPRGARVIIDGRAYGKTPMLVPELSVGAHTVRFELDGHTSASSPVTVKAGEQARLSMSLVRR
jgi:serine/threonine protein kinase